MVKSGILILAGILSLGTAQAQKNSTLSADHAIQQVYSYGFVDLEGAKVKALIVEYNQEILASSLQKDTYEIENYTINQLKTAGYEKTIEQDFDAIHGNEGSLERVYVNTQPKTAAKGSAKGRYVVIECNTAYMLTGQNLPYTISMMGGVTQKKAVNGVKGTIAASETPIRNYTATERQGWGGRMMTYYDTERDKILLPEFEPGTGWTIHYMGKDGFKAHHCYSEYTGKYEDFELPYSLYIPSKELLESHKGDVALVIHMEHAGGNDTDPYSAITSSRAAVKLADPAFQKKHPAIVVVPQVEESRRSTDDYDASSELNAAAWELLDSLLAAYKGYINEDRIYGTGQSMGGMTILNMATQRDNFFGGIAVIGAQWSNNYNKPFQHNGSPTRTPQNDPVSFNGWGLDAENFLNWYYMISDDNILVHTCKDDPMATGEWQYVADYYEACGVKIPTVELDPHSDLAGQNAKDRELVNHENKTAGSGISWGKFTNGNHMSTWKYGYQLDAPFEWLFNQTRTTAQKRPKLEQLKKPFLGREADGKVKTGSGTAGLNTAQFTPGGGSNAFCENWKPLQAVQTLIDNLPAEKNERTQRTYKSAKQFYDQLTSEEKAQITGADKLNH